MIALIIVEFLLILLLPGRPATLRRPPHLAIRVGVSRLLGRLAILLLGGSSGLSLIVVPIVPLLILALIVAVVVVLLIAVLLVVARWLPTLRRGCLVVVLLLSLRRALLLVIVVLLLLLVCHGGCGRSQWREYRLVSDVFASRGPTAAFRKRLYIKCTNGAGLGLTRQSGDMGSMNGESRLGATSKYVLWS